MASHWRKPHAAFPAFEHPAAFGGGLTIGAMVARHSCAARPAASLTDRTTRAALKPSSASIFRRVRPFLTRGNDRLRMYRSAAYAQPQEPRITSVGASRIVSRGRFGVFKRSTSIRAAVSPIRPHGWAITVRCGSKHN